MSTADPVLTVAATGGIGGVVAYLMLHWKRQDDKEHRQDIKDLLDRALQNDKEHRKELHATNEQVMQLTARVLEVSMTSSQVLQAVLAAVQSMEAASKDNLDERLTRIENAVGVKSDGKPTR